MLLAPDTNLLLHPTPRTLLHAIAIEQGREVLVLPEIPVSGFPIIEQIPG